MIKFERIKRTDERITKLMAIHYSAPKGFVGRNLCYVIYYNNILYGAIVGGSATLHLPNRHEFFGTSKKDLNNIINNIFYHVEKVDGKYPLRWFTAKVLLEWEKIIVKDWEEKYKDKVIGIESLVELPRTGECYYQSGYTLIGQTHGYTCKRIGGKGTDDWSGKRVWDVENLRPKLVFVKKDKIITTLPHKGVEKMNVFEKGMLGNGLVKSWCNEIEPSANNQIQNLSSLPFMFHHVAIMPDCHTGYGMPIGGVLATEGVVIPNAVGVDIGCGMCAVKTSLKVEQVTSESLKRIMTEIRKVIPLGMNRHQHAQDRSLMPIDEAYAPLIWKQEYGSALKSLGTLGGGNHFIEIQKDTEGSVWIMIHSGSRNLGKKVADHYNALAVEINEKYFSVVPKNWELAFLPLNTQEAKDYITEMNNCVAFALANRTLMMNRILDIFKQTFHWDYNEDDGGLLENNVINIAHNYARMEHHFGRDVMVHRKGATSARAGEIGIIPGSQGSKSYIVRGLGNEESFQSCSHGAGRKMGRKQASRELNLQDEIKKLNDQGIIHAIRTEKDLDEASGAYKSIDEVMNSQKDLVEILVELSPLAVIKG